MTVAVQTAGARRRSRRERRSTATGRALGSRFGGRTRTARHWPVQPEGPHRSLPRTLRSVRSLCVDTLRRNRAVRKPHPGVFLSAANSLGVAPSECLVVEDSAAGVLAAKAGECAWWPCRPSTTDWNLSCIGGPRVDLARRSHARMARRALRLEHLGEAIGRGVGKGAGGEVIDRLPTGTLIERQGFGLGVAGL